MTPRERLAAASRSLKPLQQGNLDGLCGLYAVINSVQLALYPDHRLTKAELTDLFDAGLTVLRMARVLQPTILLGIHEQMWWRASEAIVAKASAISGIVLTIDGVALDGRISDRELIRLIRHSINAGSPALLLIQGGVDHWTVVCRCSKARLTLFDSADRRWLLMRTVGLSRRGQTAPYPIGRRGLAALIRWDT